MAREETVIWRGASGEYKYWIYALLTNFNSGQDGNYIYTKIVGDRWTPIYIGQGDLASRTNIENHNQSHCLKSKGATHIHVHTNGREADRKAEEADLLKAHQEAYKPTGCNEKVGG